MGGSGNSGTVRFDSPDTQENFLAALGVHNNKRWCDIVTNLNSTETGTTVQAEYYNGGPRAEIKELQLASCIATNSKGRTFNLIYTTADGNDLKTKLVIGLGL